MHPAQILLFAILALAVAFLGYSLRDVSARQGELARGIAKAAHDAAAAGIEEIRHVAKTAVDGLGSRLHRVESAGHGGAIADLESRVEALERVAGISAAPEPTAAQVHRDAASLAFRGAFAATAPTNPVVESFLSAPSPRGPVPRPSIGEPANGSRTA